MLDVIINHVMKICKKEMQLNKEKEKNMPKVNRVGIRRRSKGTYNIRFRIDNEDFDFTIDADSDTQASEIRAKYISESKSGLLVKDTDIILNEFYVQFRKDYLIPRVAPVTLHDYESVFKRYVETRIGKKQIQKIRPRDIYKFYEDVRKTTNAKEGTLKIVHAYLRKCFNFAVDLDVISKNPMAKIPSPKSDPSKFVVWSAEEVQTFLDFSKAKNIWTYYPMAFTIMTGLRRSEVLGLKWVDIDFERGVIKLTRTVHELVGQEFPVIQSGKTDRSMTTIPIPEVALNLLKDIKAHQVITVSDVGKDLFNNKDGWIFVLDNGSLIKPNWLTTRFRRNLNLIPSLPKPMNIKGFRHMFATFLLQKNAHPKLVQELMRHSTFKLTMDTYSHVVESMGKETVSLMNEVFSGVKQSNG